MNREALAERTGLGAAALDRLEALAQSLPLMAELMSADLFIDCRAQADGMLFVAAQAGPSAGPSAYAGNVLGSPARRESEPAAYWALEAGVPMRDIKAVTQENRIVRQTVVPIRDADGAAYAVLIAEADVSRDMQREKKYQALARRAEEQPAAGSVTAETLMQRELHHRVKNHLQMMASIMNLQMRQTRNEEVRKAFQENSARVLSIAAINDILLAGRGETVGLLTLLDRLRQNLDTLYNGDGCAVICEIRGDEIALPHARAADIAMVVNELLTNARKHAFRGRTAGHIQMFVQKGTLFSTIAIRDDGVGLPAAGMEEGLGMSIVRMTIHDKLGGELHMTSDANGSIFSFDFSDAE